MSRICFQFIRDGKPFVVADEDVDADLKIPLIELLAYVGDVLSSAQDSVANEAYLATDHCRALRKSARAMGDELNPGEAVIILGYERKSSKEKRRTGPRGKRK